MAETTIPDAITTTLSSLIGTNNDRQIAALVGLLSPPPPDYTTIDELWGLLATQLGVTDGTIQDRKLGLMSMFTGITGGAYNDVELAFWNTLTPPAVYYRVDESDSGARITEDGYFRIIE